LVAACLQPVRAADADPAPGLLFVLFDSEPEGLAGFGDIIPIDVDRPPASLGIGDLHRTEISRPQIRMLLACHSIGILKDQGHLAVSAALNGGKLCREPYGLIGYIHRLVPDLLQSHSALILHQAFVLDNCRIAQILHRQTSILQQDFDAGIRSRIGGVYVPPLGSGLYHLLLHLEGIAGINGCILAIHGHEPPSRRRALDCYPLGAALRPSGIVLAGGGYQEQVQAGAKVRGAGVGGAKSR